MFGMGLSEIFMIAVIAILFLGPDKLPETMIQIAKFFKSLKRTIDDAKSSLDEELRIGELKEEALKYKKQLDAAAGKLEKVKNAEIDVLNDLTGTLDDVKASEEKLEDEAKEIKDVIEPKRETVTFKKNSTKRNSRIYGPSPDEDEDDEAKSDIIEKTEQKESNV